MIRGSPAGEELKLVTVDLTEESNNFLPNQSERPMIHKIVGDANSSEVIRQISEEFGEKPVDLVYIDADHSELPTFLNFAIYATLLKPKVVICDDIELTESMRSFWRLAKSCATPELAVNVVDFLPVVRATGKAPASGFGYIRLRT